MRVYCCSTNHHKKEWLEIKMVIFFSFFKKDLFMIDLEREKERDRETIWILRLQKKRKNC